MSASRLVALVIALAACGGSQPAPAEPHLQAPPDTRTPIEKRRDVAAESIAKRATKCAVDEARAELQAGKISQTQFNTDTAADLQAKLTEDWIKKLEVPLNSYQVRVLEVCNKQADSCDDLNECIQHINDKSK